MTDKNWKHIHIKILIVSTYQSNNQSINQMNEGINQ